MGSLRRWSECDSCTSTRCVLATCRCTPSLGAWHVQEKPLKHNRVFRENVVPWKRAVEKGSAADLVSVSVAVWCVTETTDCDDNLDETNCDRDDQPFSCDLDKTPPNSDYTGRGVHCVDGELRAGVINTRSFGGDSGQRRQRRIVQQCLVVHSAHPGQLLSTHNRRTFHKELTEHKAYRLIVLKNKWNWPSFRTPPLTAPEVRHALPLRGLARRRIPSLVGVRPPGVHLIQYDRYRVPEVLDEAKGRWFGRKEIRCETLMKSFSSRGGHKVNKMPIKVNIFGGDPSFIGALSILDLEKPEANGEIYENWASSVKDFPDVINQKLRPLHELVKEVQCAGLKKLHLKRATEEYLAEEDPATAVHATTTASRC
ncbi:unnamed protein product [Pleuronectes platessa]|uniref:MACPF domain-containing protein n=1 Tax=Pleuronectes platessa TaxID=8262 RepID=A0A9N7V4Z0_PLEPL|nr:unnamed protein product [Pleuronectes platessa]